jgi:hypothetical protein
MPHLSPAHHETSKHDSPNETRVKEKQNETVLDSNSNLAKSMTHHNQIKELTTWFLINSRLCYPRTVKKYLSELEQTKEPSQISPRIVPTTMRYVALSHQI